MKCRLEGSTSGILWVFFKPVVTFRKSGTKGFEPRRAGPFLRQTDVFVFSPDIIDRALRDALNVDLCLLRDVNVLQWYWECLLITCVQRNSKICMMAVNVVSAHGPRTFTGTLSLDARPEHNIIFLLEVALGW